jgi:ligand-binding sensor domain-containing protein
VGAYTSGLTQFKNQKLTQYLRPSAIEQFGVRSICEDFDGSLWLGTYGGGLCRMKNGKFKIFTMKDGLPQDKIFSLLVTRDSSLWIGTRSGGLCRYKNNKFMSSRGSRFQSVDWDQQRIEQIEEWQI